MEMAGNMVIAGRSYEGRLKVGRRYVGESIRTSPIKSRNEPQISVELLRKLQTWVFNQQSSMEITNLVG